METILGIRDGDGAAAALQHGHVVAAVQEGRLTRAKNQGGIPQRALTELKCYEALSGEGILLNTSFNLHGDPLVNHPAEALEVFDRSVLNYPALGNGWV